VSTIGTAKQQNNLVKMKNFFTYSFFLFIYELKGCALSIQVSVQQQDGLLPGISSPWNLFSQIGAR